MVQGFGGQHPVATPRCAQMPSWKAARRRARESSVAFLSRSAYQATATAAAVQVAQIPTGPSEARVVGQ